MSTVLSYCAFRAQPLSQDEAAAIDIVIARYQSDFEYRDTANAFLVHPQNLKIPQVIFSGTICMPKNDVESHTYWMYCLTDIRHILEDAAWQISLGDVALDWDDDHGWCLPKSNP